MLSYWRIQHFRRSFFAEIILLQSARNLQAQGTRVNMRLTVKERGCFFRRLCQFFSCRQTDFPIFYRTGSLFVSACHLCKKIAKKVDLQFYVLSVCFKQVERFWISLFVCRKQKPGNQAVTSTKWNQLYKSTLTVEGCNPSRFLTLEERAWKTMVMKTNTPLVV